MPTSVTAAIAMASWPARLKMVAGSSAPAGTVAGIVDAVSGTPGVATLPASAAAVPLHGGSGAVEGAVDGAVAQRSVQFAPDARGVRSAVQRAVALRSAKALVSLCWKAGLTPRCAVQAQTALAGIAPALALQPTAEGGWPLREEEMTWQLSMLAEATA